MFNLLLIVSPQKNFDNRTPFRDGPATFAQAGFQRNAPRFNSSLTLLQRTNRSKWMSYIPWA